MSIPVPAGSDYVALGSSFAAGPGLRPRAAGAPRASGRSTINYAHLLARRLDLTLHDVSFSGATVTDISVGGRRPPQVDAVGPATRLVTLTVGGNDVGYLSALTSASLPRPLRGSRLIRARVDALVDAGATTQRFHTLRSSLAQLIQEIARRAPAAKIMLVDYLSILPPHPLAAALATAGIIDPPGSSLPFSEPLVRWGQDVAGRLSETFAAVSAEQNAVFVAIGDESRDHHAWSAAPWTRRFHLTLHNGAAYHPNAEGMRAVAEIVERKLS